MSLFHLPVTVTSIKETEKVVGHKPGVVKDICNSKDSRSIVTTGFDNMLRIWDWK